MDRLRTIRLRSAAMLAAMIAMTFATTFVSGCAGLPQDGRYQTHDGGRSNFRAEVPAAPITRFS